MGFMGRRETDNDRTSYRRKESYYKQPEFVSGDVDNDEEDDDDPGFFRRNAKKMLAGAILVAAGALGVVTVDYLGNRHNSDGSVDDTAGYLEDGESD